MNGENSKQDRHDPDGQYCPFHDESLLVNANLSWYSCNMFIMKEQRLYRLNSFKGMTPSASFN